MCKLQLEAAAAHSLSTHYRWTTVTMFSAIRLTGKQLTSARWFSVDRAIKVVKLNALILLDGAPHRVMKITQGKRGKGGGFVKAKLQHVFNNATFEKTFTSDESVEEASYEKKKAQFSWSDGDELVFMDSETFEEIRISKKTVDDAGSFKEGETYRLLKCEGKYIGIDLMVNEHL